VSDQSIYSDHAEAYAAFCQHSAPNAHYDRPAILRLAGDVTGKRVLELGCAAGVLTEHLVDMDAEVLALDREPGLITGWLLSDQADYHRVELVSENWDLDGQVVTAKLYCRPISAIFGQLRQAGFVVDVVDEPRPATGSDAAPRMLHVLNTEPVFLFLRAHLDG
jgi:hypothetical protein